LPGKVKVPLGVPLGIAFFTFCVFHCCEKASLWPEALRGRSIDGKKMKAGGAIVFPQGEAGLSGARPGNT